MVISTIITISLIGIFSYSIFKGRLLDVSNKQLNIISREATVKIYDVAISSIENERIDKLDETTILLRNLDKFQTILNYTEKDVFLPLNFKGSIYLTDSNGEVILHSNSKEEGKDYSKKEYFKRILADKRNKIMHRENEKDIRGMLAKVATSGYGEYVKDDKEYIFNYSKVASLGWIVVLEAEKGIIYKGAHKIGLIVFSFGGFAVLIVTLIAIVIYKKLYKQEEKLHKFATFDSLTGVFNRRTGLKLLEEQYNFCKENNYKLSICFIDIDGLKTVNDKYGHKEGDRLITLVSDILKENLREKDIICRMGGDEFLLIFPQCNLRQSINIWSRIESEFRKTNNELDTPYKLAASHGFVEYSQSKDLSLEELIELADNKMYKDKEMNKKDRLDY